MDGNARNSQWRAQHSGSVRVRNLPSQPRFRSGAIDGRYLFALAWSVILAGLIMTVSATDGWIRARSALPLSAPELFGTFFVWLGGVLIAVTLHNLVGLRWSSVRALVLAGVATIVATDVPWFLAATVTASRPRLGVIYNLCLQATHVALTIDALLVLALAVGASFVVVRHRTTHTRA